MSAVLETKQSSELKESKDSKELKESKAQQELSLLTAPKYKGEHEYTEHEAKCIADIMKYSQADTPIYEDVLHEAYQVLTQEDPIEALEAFFAEKQRSYESKEQAEFLKTHRLGKNKITFEHFFIEFYSLHILFMSAKLNKIDILRTMVMGPFGGLQNLSIDRYPFVHMAMEFSSFEYVFFAMQAFKDDRSDYRLKGMNFDYYSWAAYRGRKDIVQQYLKLCRLQKNKEFLSNLFTCAVMGGDIPTVQYLYECNKDILKEEQSNPDGLSYFMAAASAGKIPVLQYLLSLDSEIWKYETPVGRNAFMAAARGEFLENPTEGPLTLEFLLNKFGKDFCLKTLANGDNAFMEAVRGNQIENLEFLLTVDEEFYKKVNAEGCNALLLSDEAISVDTLAYLLCKDSTLIHSVDNNNENALHKAARSGNVERFSYLANKGIKIGQLSNQGKDERAIALECGKPGMVTLLDDITATFARAPQALDMKFDKTFPINCRDNTGKSLLHHACESKVSNRVALSLIKQGIKRDIVDDSGKTYLAVVLAQKDIKFLVDSYQCLVEQIDNDPRSSDFDKKLRKEILHKEYAEIFEKVVGIDPRKYKNFNEEDVINTLDFLGDNFEKVYWLHFARLVSECSVRNISELENADGPHTLSFNRKLSELIFSRTLVCKELSNGKLDFELGKDLLVSSKEEDPIQREVRLRNALTFAVLGGDTQKILMLHMEIAVPGTSMVESHKLNRSIEGMGPITLIAKLLSGLYGTLHTKGQELRFSEQAVESKGAKEKEAIQGLDDEEAEAVETVEESGLSSLASLASLSLTPTSVASTAKDKKQVPTKILQFSQGGQAAPVGLGLSLHQEAQEDVQAPAEDSSKTELDKTKPQINQ